MFWFIFIRGLSANVTCVLLAYEKQLKNYQIQTLLESGKHILSV